MKRPPPKKKYHKAIIINGVKYCRIEGCDKKALKNCTLCSKHKHRRRLETQIEKLYQRQAQS